MSERLVINMDVLVGILGTFSWQKNDILQLENRQNVVHLDDYSCIFSSGPSPGR